MRGEGGEVYLNDYFSCAIELLRRCSPKGIQTKNTNGVIMFSFYLFIFSSGLITCAYEAAKAKFTNSSTVQYSILLSSAAANMQRDLHSIVTSINTHTMTTIGVYTNHCIVIGFFCCFAPHASQWFCCHSLFLSLIKIIGLVDRNARLKSTLTVDRNNGLR